MPELLVLANAMFAIVLVVLLVIVVRVHPFIALLVGPMYLGLSSGLGFVPTITAITTGFGELMGEIGLLIAFGIMIGSFMQRMGAFQRVVDLLTNRMAPGRIPYALTGVVTAIFPAIYTDVLLLMATPLARRIAARMGPEGVPVMAAATSVGIYLALTLVVPGVGALALAAMLGVDLGTMLLFGLIVALPTGFITVFLVTRLARRGLWDPALDETTDATEVVDEDVRPISLRMSLLPVLVPIAMIAAGAVDRALGLGNPMLTAVGNSTFALFVGMVIALLIAKARLPIEVRLDAMSGAFAQSGQILLLTGVAGSLSAVVALTDLGDILSGYFSADTSAPLVLVWLIAAVLHIAIGSVSASAITSAALLAPVAQTLGISPVLIALAAGSGALFLVHVTSNSFWMMSSLMGLTVRGTLKGLSLPVSLASLVSLPIILLLSTVL
ncbi:GntP family permease [Falsirhodobacter sp. 20TX0035]|uniref:GntP family permease n=1 Tax=Falsirhodobacter sp. 20TX0035 TaxID=3022019 RepID=UPI00232CB7BB|nr:hypothetical protein [Falsirhodobacter sp. 20TX0035]MDB6453768.1 hypothetical protein [Falsirhodobacter sp. 20TX0035]